MKSRARLIYKSYMTYFHTFLPVYFYGMPNGKIYCIYARFFENRSDKSGLEFVFAQHDDLSYDYEAEKLTAYGYKEINKQDFVRLVDSPEQRITILKIYGNLSSYAEAQAFLNEKAQIMITSLEPEEA